MSGGSPVPYHTSDLEVAVSTMREALRSHAERIATLELAVRAARGAVQSVDAPPASASSPSVLAATAFRPPALPNATLRLAGRVVIIVAGGFALRALTDSGMTSGWLGAALGLGYALAFLLAADRAAAKGGRVSASVHGASTLLLAFPLLDEAVVRLHLLGPTAAILATAGVTAAAFAVAVRHRLRLLAWLAASGAIVVALVLAFQTGQVLPTATFLLGLGGVCIWLEDRLDGGLRWAIAPVADLCVLILAIRSASPYAEEQPAVALGLVAMLPAVYLASFALRTLRLRRSAGAFEFAQAVGAIGVAAAGATAIAPHLPSAVNWLGAAAAACGVTAYAPALQGRCAPTPAAVFRFHTTLGLLLVTSGTALALSGPWVAAAWSVLAVASATLARRPGRKGMAVHAAVYAWGAALAGGLLALCAIALAAPANHGWPPQHAAPLVALAAAILSAGLLATAALEARAGRAARLSRLALLVVGAAGAAGVAVAALAPLAVRVLGAGASQQAVPPLRTLALAGGAVMLAWLGQREPLRDANWPAYAMLVLAGLEIVTDALPSGSPTALALAFAGYGAALLLVARLRRRLAARLSRDEQSHGGGLTSPRRAI